MLELHHELTFRLKVKGPLAATKGSPVGTLEYWEMAAGTLTGDRLQATIVMPGGDWMSVGDDGYNRPDVRIQFQTDDGAIVLLHYTGLVERSETFRKAAESGNETSFPDQYMRMSMRFETGSQTYRWLNESLFVAEGRLAGPSEIEYRIYRLL